MLGVSGHGTVVLRLGLSSFAHASKSHEIGIAFLRHDPEIYKHDPLGQGDVPLAGIAPAMKEVGYTELPMLEVISLNPDSDIADSCRRLREAGFGNA
jgi:sugar phosphate isomerase/epimerase